MATFLSRPQCVKRFLKNWHNFIPIEVPIHMEWTATCRQFLTYRFKLKLKQLSANDNGDVHIANCLFYMHTTSLSRRLKIFWDLMLPWCYNSECQGTWSSWDSQALRPHDYMFGILKNLHCFTALVGCRVSKSKPWMNFVRHKNAPGEYFKAVNMLSFSLICVRKYLNATVYMVCAFTSWFITIKTMLEFMRRHSLVHQSIWRKLQPRVPFTNMV